MSFDINTFDLSFSGVCFGVRVWMKRNPNEGKMAAELHCTVHILKLYEIVVGGIVELW